MWYFVITMLFNGGLIPWFMVIWRTGLIDSIWALILPSAVPVFHVVILMNFFRGLPPEIEEAALIDGASHWTILLRIFLSNYCLLLQARNGFLDCVIVGSR
jgi:putative aldouronate transport system permease protein